MRLVRMDVNEWGLDPGRVGMLGFPARGEVVALIAYVKGEGDPKAQNVSATHGRLAE